jgi:hypothetical protein
MDILILDINIPLADPQSIFDFDFLPQYQIVILKPVMEELDGLKSSDGSTGYQAREASRFLEGVILNSSRTEYGWQINDTGTLILDEETDRKLSPEDRKGSHDDRILASVELFLQETEGSEDGVWLVTLDRNMRIRAEGREIPWFDFGAWLQVEPNTYFMPFATYGINWSEQGNVGLRLPVDLADLGEGWIEVWSYLGYPSGLFSTLHVRLFEPDNDGPIDQEHASPVLILNADNKFLYGHRMTDIPHKVVNVSQTDTGVVYHKNWKLEVGLKRCEVAKPVKISDYRKQQA